MVIEIQPRKIFPAGGTYQLSLPMIWVRHHRLSRGSKVTLEINDFEELVVRPWREDT